MAAEQDVRLITISRELGAGGSELAAELGRRLAWPVLDADIVRRVAERLRLDDRTMRHFDEHPPSLLARMATVLIVPQPDVHSFSVDGDLPSHDAIADATRVVIEELGEPPPLIVVGHGAPCIFCRRPEALHLRVVAPVAVRLTRVMRRLTVDPAYARTLLHRADRDRQACVQRYFQREWRSEQLYDLQINTGRITIEEGVEIVERFARARSEARVLVGAATEA
jgi:cytidylate kinase